MSIETLKQKYEEHLEANWTREGKRFWKGQIAFASFDKCTECGGRGYVNYFWPEYPAPIMSDICRKCNGHKVELTDDVRRWLAETAGVFR